MSTACTVSSPGNYFYGNVNIVAGGSLIFKEPTGTGTLVNFWASNIIVEAGGSLIAGSENTPYGSRRGVLDIYIYGPNQSTGNPATSPGQGALCYGQLSGTTGPCGIPLSLWTDNGTSLQTMPGAGAISDYFYQYGPNYGDSKCTDGTTWANGQCGTSAGQVGYFGYKVLAVSYNGTLKLFGYKGTPLKRAKAVRPFSPFFPSQGGQGSSFSASSRRTRLRIPKNRTPSRPPKLPPRPSTLRRSMPILATAASAGCAWPPIFPRRPQGNKGNPNELILSQAPGDRWWSANDNKSTPDQVVVTTTDYLPGHSEKLTIRKLKSTMLSFWDPVEYPHNGMKYPVASRLDGDAQRFL